MSARFYFDVKIGDKTIWDDIGVMAADLEQAVAEARSVIMEMIEEIQIEPGEALMLIVSNADGTLVARLPIER
ncbi:hypothetical protein ADL19_05605 [Streptomyces purpurogeneiscleroticus]|nr:hypothetical protein ADL19_05605 [Streptomyces purpurogeneiscleroticus]